MNIQIRCSSVFIVGFEQAFVERDTSHDQQNKRYEKGLTWSDLFLVGFGTKIDLISGSHLQVFGTVSVCISKTSHKSTIYSRLHPDVSQTF